MSANAAKGRIISIAEARKAKTLVGSQPPPFDPEAIQQRINRVRTAPTPDEKEIALALVCRDAEQMLRILAVMGAEIIAYRQRIQAFATQASDTSIINSLLLHELGDEVRVDAEWFAAWDPPSGSGFSVTEEGTEIVVRAITVADPTEQVVDSVSASQQTEEA